MKSNITKNFQAKAKRGLCLADGLAPEQPIQPQQAQPYGAGVNGIDGMSIGGGQYYGDLKNMDRLTAGQYTNDPDILNAAMDREGPKRYLDYSPQPVQMANKMADSMPVAPQKRAAPRITAFDEALQPTGLRQARSPSGFADGMVPETADQLMARMAQKYGTTGATPQVAAPQPAPVQHPAPAPQPKPQTGGLFSQALRGLRGANDELRKAANYKDGMVHEGPGIVHGPGGPREDKVDAKLSNGEAVLPAATVEYLGGTEEVAELIEKTNGKAPTMGLRDGAHANMGGFVDDFGNLNEPNKFQGGSNRITLHQQLAAANPAAQAAPTGQTVSSGFVQPQATPTAFDDEVRSRIRATGTASPEASAYTKATQVAPTAPTVVEKPTLTSRAVGSAKNLGEKAMSLGGKAMSFAGKAAPFVAAADMTHSAATGLNNQENRSVEDIDSRGGFIASSLKDGFPMLSAAGQKIGDDIGRVVTAAQGGVNPNTGKAESLWSALTTMDGGKTALDYNKENASAPTPTKPKTSPATGDYNSGYDAKEAARAKAAPIMVAEQNPNVLGLRAAGVTGQLQGDVTENGKTGTAGIRTIETGNGKVYAGRDAKGQLHVNSGLEQGSLADIDKARDAKFAAAGYGKDAYGNWMTPERIAAKDQLRGIQYENAKFNATSDQITDPNARAAGLRGLAQYDTEEKLRSEKATAAAKLAHDNAKLQLDLRGQNITLAGHKAMQGNTENATRAARDKDRRSRAKDLLDMHATSADKDGKPVMNAGLRAELERAYLGANGGRLMDLPDEGPDGYEALSTQAINQARLSHAVKTAMQKDKAGWNFNNIGKKANTTLNAAEMSYDNTTDTLSVGGYKLKGKDVWGDDSDLANLVQTRKPKAQ